VPWTDAEHAGVYTECPDSIPDDGLHDWAYAEHNTPNPFNPLTTVNYGVPDPGGRVRLAIYDLAGRRVRLLLDEEKAPGDYAAIWRGRDDAGRELGSGVYFYRLEIGEFMVERKMVMLK